MESYKVLNRELTAKNQELRQLLNLHRLESVALHKKWMEERESFDQMKKLLVFEITNSFNSILKVLYPEQSDKLLLSNSHNSDTSEKLSENKENESNTTVVRAPLAEIKINNVTRRRAHQQSHQYGDESSSTQVTFEERSFENENSANEGNLAVETENESNIQLPIISEESTISSNSTLTPEQNSQTKTKTSMNSVISVENLSCESFLEEQPMDLTRRFSSVRIPRYSSKISKTFEGKRNGNTETLTSNYLSLSETGYDAFTMSNAPSSTPRKSLNNDGEVDKSVKNVKVVLTRINIDKFINIKDKAELDDQSTVKKTEDDNSRVNLVENTRRTRSRAVKEESIDYPLETTDSMNFKRPKRKAASLIKNLAEPSAKVKMRRDT